ncbi:MAG: 50S ribosomal protein L33 [Deltaproteobacteria bacterium]|nr:50S ribosomal protein L33 [Deltaproteobacteria bacterium]
MTPEEAPWGRSLPRVASRFSSECTTCRESEVPGVSRYPTTKNKKKTPGRIEFSKYCRFERKHTLHREVK